MDKTENSTESEKPAQSTSTFPDQQTLTLQQALNLAVQHHSEGDLSQATGIYQQILETDPNHPDALHLLGVIAHQGGENARAVELITKALAIKPDFAEAHGNLGTVFKEIGRLDEAVASYRSALRMKPDFTESQFNLGNALRELGRLDEAVVHYRKVIQIRPNDAKTHYNLGATLRELRRLEEAVTSYRQALTIDPDVAEAHTNLGNVLEELGLLEEARKSYDKAIAIKPDYAEAHSNLGNVLEELGLLEEARVSYDKAIAIKPNYAEAHFNLGKLFKQLGQLDEAITSYSEVLSIQPEFAKAHYNLGNLLRDMARFDDALAHYHKALIIKSDYADVHNNLGIVFQELGKLNEATASYHKALAIKPDYADTHNNLGILYQGQGKLEEAVASYHKAIDIKSDHAEAYYNLGNVLKDLGKFQEAVAHYQKSFTSRTGIQQVGNGELSPATSTLYLELTNKCNFHCDFCPSDSQKRALGFMDLELAKRTYEEVANKQLVPNVHLHLMGEPTLHPKLIDILKFGASKNVRTELITNGSTLVAKVVPRILDTLYGTIVASHMTPTEETYHFRGKVGLSWDRYIGNIRLLIREYMKRLANGKDTRNEINLRVMVTKDTASNVNVIESSEEALTILTEWVEFTAEVERELGLPPFKRLEPVSLLQRGLHEFKRYRLQQGIVLTFWDAFTFANTRVSNDYDLQKTEETVFCPHPFQDFGVLWNGDVTLCCMDYDGQLKVGNILDTSIESVMQGKAAQDLRSSMLGHRPLPSVCQTCQARPVKREESAPDTISEQLN